MSPWRSLRFVATALALLAVAFVVPKRHLTAVGPARVLGVTSHSPEPAVATAAACCVDCPAHGFGRVGDRATSRSPTATRQTSPRPVDDPRRSSGAPSAPLRPPRVRHA